MNPITLLKLKAFAVKWWRELTIAVLALLLLACAGAGRETKKALLIESEKRAVVEDSLTKTAKLLTLQTYRTQAAEESVRTLKVQLTRAQTTETTREPVLLPDGQVGYRERTASTDNTRTEYDERAAMEIRFASQAEKLEQAELALFNAKAQILDLRERVRQTEESKTAPRWLAVGEYEPGRGEWSAGAGLNLGPVSVFGLSPVAELRPRLGIGLRF